MKKNLTLPCGEHTLKLVNFRDQPHLKKVTLIFKGLSNDNQESFILRTFKYQSSAFREFIEKYCEKLKPLEESLNKLRGSLFKVKLGPAQNPKYTNIEEFLD